VTLIIPPGFGNAAFVFSSTSGTPPIVTTLGVDISAYGGDFVQAANDLMDVWSVNLGAQVWSDLTLDRVNLAVGQDGPGGSVDSTQAPIPMTRSGTYPPVATAAIARKVTNDIGRRGRGRMFLPSTLSESEVDPDGSIVSARITSLSSALIDFYEDLGTADTASFPMDPFLFHSSAPTDPTPITGLTLATLVGWVRGRIR